MIGLAPMQQHRTFRLQVDQAGNAAAVVRNCAGQTRSRAGGLPCNGAAPAIADDAGLAGVGDRLHRRRHVLHRIVQIDLLDDGDAALNLLLRVAGFVISLHAVEQGRRDGHVTIRRVAVGNGTDVTIDAEDLHSDHQTAFGFACRLRNDKQQTNGRRRPSAESVFPSMSPVVNGRKEREASTLAALRDSSALGHSMVSIFGGTNTRAPARALRGTTVRR